MNELANLIIEKVNIEKYLYLIALTLARPNNPRDCNNHASRTSKWFFIIYFSMNHRGAWQRRCWPLLSSWILWLPHFDQCRGVFFSHPHQKLGALEDRKIQEQFYMLSCNDYGMHVQHFKYHKDDLIPHDLGQSMIVTCGRWWASFFSFVWNLYPDSTLTITSHNILVYLTNSIMKMHAVTT